MTKIECQRCGAIVSKYFFYFSGKFQWDRLCEFCRDRMKLEDWEHGCTPDVRAKD